MTSQPLDPLIAQAGSLIEQRTGLAVGAQFRIDLENILFELAQGNIAQYIATLRENRPTAPEWQALLRALTIGETYFFRDATLFQLLRTTILPELLHTHRQEITIWCAGCATGEEAYSVAILLDEVLPDANLRLFASDINAHALDIARQGMYREWSFRHSTSDFQARYFDATPGGWQIKPHLRQRVTFRHANLLDGTFTPPCNLVFCRNTLLYFGRGFVEAGENVLYDALAPGGWLILGQSEAIRTQRDRWKPRVFGTSMLYQKPTLTPPPTALHPLAAVRDLPALSPVYSAALYAAHHDQASEAERMLRALLAADARDVPARLLLAYLLGSRHTLNEAHNLLENALQIDPLQANAHYLRATLHLEAGQFDEAERALRAALYCQRDHPLATFLLGNVYYKAGDTTRAVRLWENAHQTVTRLQPDSWFSDFSDMTAANFASLIRTQIDSLP